MNSQQTVASRLLHIGAVKLNPTNPFTWASGWKSPIYCDNRKVLSFPYERDFIKSELCSVIFESFPEIDGIAGVATAGISWGVMAADQLKLPFVYVRPKPKEHGLGNQLEGEMPSGSRVLVVEDLISTGKSSLQVCDVLRGAGIEPVGMVSLFTYGFEIAEKAFEKEGIPLISLTNYTALLELLLKQGKINEQERAALSDWRKDPANWIGMRP
jgi:orotate phosphoribosyltransferase